MGDMTRILAGIEQGDPAAAERLLPLVYEELRNLATQKLAHEKPGQTLQATALVHEAYLRLVNVKQVQAWNNRGHFFAAAAESMRRILVEQARRKSRVRHGGSRQRVELSEVAEQKAPDSATILAVDEALSVLAAEDADAAQIVKLHFFAGFTLDETADAMGMSRATVYRQWAYARARLRLFLKKKDSDENG
jgi:RNA polymerase sigma factor (TIGR02999 family)